MAAKLAVVDYGVEDLEPPILSVEEAVERSSFFDVPPFIMPKQVGDASKGMAEADHKIISAEVPIIYSKFFISASSFDSIMYLYFIVNTRANMGESGKVSVK